MKISPQSNGVLPLLLLASLGTACSASQSGGAPATGSGGGGDSGGASGTGGTSSGTGGNHVGGTGGANNGTGGRTGVGSGGMAGGSPTGTGGGTASGGSPMGSGGAGGQPAGTGGVNGVGGAASGGSPTGSGGAGDTGGSAGGASGQPSSLLPVRLRAELRDTPIGLQTATPRLGWELQSSDAKARGQAQASYELLVATSANKLAADQGDLWATGVVSGNDTSVTYAGGPLASAAHVVWKVRVHDEAGRMSAWSAPAELTIGLLAPGDWGAQWITGGGTTGTLPIFRREVAVSKPVQRALAFICGLGQYELRINGTNVSDAVMEPSWTTYAKTCHYAAYDVTSLVTQGQNAVAILLGNGMYNVPASARYAKFTGSFGPPKLILRLQIEYADGTKDAVVSDATTWRTTPGPITFSNIFGGEDFDARAEPAGWDKAGFVDTAWARPTVVAGAGPTLTGRLAPPVKVQQQYATPKITQPQPGVFVYDFGQNFAGWPEVTLQGTAGVAVKLTPGELLDATGVVNQASMGAPVWFSYTLKGGAPETWHPRFSYTGFRYIQVDAAVPAAQAASFPTRPQITALSGEAIYASAESVGQFTSSDADLNRIHALILAAFRSNLQNVLTDCPHREKLGWLETSHLLATGIMFNFDVATFYEKIIRDMRDGQGADGLIPDIAPEMTVFAGAFRDSPEWGSAYILAPWRVYQMYGDRQPLGEHYANMKRYVTYLAGKATGNIVAYGLGDWYDVGPAAPGASQLTTAGVTATAIWLEDMQVMQQAATLLGNTADATQYQSTIATVTNAFNAKFLAANGTFDRGSQTGQAMPIALGLVPDAQRANVITRLVSSVTGAQNRVTAGDVGFRYLVHALSQAGRDDVMFSMVKQSAGPGYLYQVNRGATALTEAWDANPADSQNHAMLGHAEEWLYSGLGGISTDPAAPGWKKFIVRPQPQTGVASVNVQYHSIQGPITSAWQRGAGTAVTYTVSIPPNTTATITLPTANPAGVTEGGMPATSAPGITANTTGTSTLQLVAGSGNYVFMAP